MIGPAGFMAHPRRPSYVPVTPAGTPCLWLASRTEQEAIKRLLIDASHMPYRTWENFQRRGYTIEQMPVPPAEERVP